MYIYVQIYTTIKMSFISLINRNRDLLFIGHGSDTSNTTEEALKLIRRSLKGSSMERVEGACFNGNYPHVFVTFGASVSCLFLDLY